MALSKYSVVTEQRRTATSVDKNNAFTDGEMVLADQLD